MMRPLWLEVTRMEHVYCRLPIADLKTEDGSYCGLQINQFVIYD